MSVSESTATMLTNTVERLLKRSAYWCASNQIEIFSLSELTNLGFICERKLLRKAL
jgi:hypothetical protein